MKLTQLPLLVVLSFPVMAQNGTYTAESFESDSRQFRLLGAEAWDAVYQEFGFLYRTNAILQVCGANDELLETLINRDEVLDELRGISINALRSKISEITNTDLAIMESRVSDLQASLYLQLTAYAFAYQDLLTTIQNISVASDAMDVLCAAGLHSADEIHATKSRKN